MTQHVSKKIKYLISQFWRDDDEQGKKMHWYSWGKLCSPKKEEGMGFCDLRSFNLVILLKQVWSLFLVFLTNARQSKSLPSVFNKRTVNM
jgi:hypothetical protein